MSEVQQRQKAFFDPTPERAYKHLPSRPTAEQIDATLTDPRCPLNRIIVSEANVQNQNNKRVLRRSSGAVLSRYNHSPRGESMGFYSPPGQGKTFIVKSLAETWGIIFVFVNSGMLKNTYHLFNEIVKAAQKFGSPIIEMKSKYADYTLPPMIVFFDESHDLCPALMEGALLNAMEPDDAIMMCNMPGTKGESFHVDCKDVCWIGATTHRGRLFPAFASRLLTAIEWEPATEEELPLIVKAGLDAKFKDELITVTPPLEACKHIARYQKVPRLAIHCFGKMVCQEKALHPTYSWEQAAEIVARDLGIDEWGLSRRQVEMLRILGQRPTAQSRLASQVRCDELHLKDNELPALMQYYGGGPFVIPMSGRGLCITKAGLVELERRNIRHSGDKVTAEYLESKR